MRRDANQPPLDYATGPRRDAGGAWTGIVSVAIGTFGLLWLGGGWAYYLHEAAVQTQRIAAAVAAGGPVVDGTYAAKVVLGLLVSATLPGTFVGLFLAVATRQRRPASSLGWVGLGLNTLTLLAGVGAIVLMAFG